MFKLKHHGRACFVAKQYRPVADADGISMHKHLATKWKLISTIKRKIRRSIQHTRHHCSDDN